jgi:hypothetical protein
LATARYYTQTRHVMNTSFVHPPHPLLRRFHLKPLALARYSVAETIYTTSLSHFLNCNILILTLLSPEYWREGMMYSCFRGGGVDRLIKPYMCECEIN